MNAVTGPAQAVTVHPVAAIIVPHLGCSTGFNRLFCSVNPTGGVGLYVESWNNSGSYAAAPFYRSPCVGGGMVVTVAVRDSAGNTGSQASSAICILDAH